MQSLIRGSNRLSTPLSMSMDSCISINSTNYTAVGAWSSVLQVCWATKKTGGSTKNKQDSAGKRLGVKKFGGYVPSHIIHEIAMQHCQMITFLKKTHGVTVSGNM